MNLVEKYLGERLDVVVKVIDKKTGNTISTVSAKDFQKMMDRNFKTFKFLEDAVKYYNKNYKEHHATVEIEK